MEVKDYINDDIDLAVKLLDKMLKDKRLNKTVRQEYARKMIDECR